MRHLLSFLIKLFTITIILEVVLNLLTGLTFGQIIIVSIVLTTISYLLGDILILPMAGNTIATLSDLALAFGTIYLFNAIYRNAAISIFDALFTAVILGIGEWVFHHLLQSATLPD